MNHSGRILRLAAVVFVMAAALAPAGAVSLAAVPSAAPQQQPAQEQGVVRPGGAELYDVPNGTVVGKLEAVSFVSVYGRNEDSTWLVVSTASGQTGWVMATTLIAYNIEALPVMMGETPAEPAATDTPVPPTPTPTPTPIPPTPTPVPPTATPTLPALTSVPSSRPAAGASPTVASLVAVVGVDGADLHDAPEGAVQRTLPVGSAITLVGRDSTQNWLQTRTADGATGWVKAEDIVAFNTAALAVVAGAEKPTPTAAQPDAAGEATVEPAAGTVEPAADSTPAPATGALGGAAGALGGAAGAQPAATAAVLPGQEITSTVPAETSADARPTPIADGRPLATIMLAGGRLNIRAFPSTDGRIVAKALPRDQFVALGRTAASDWIQIELLPEEGGFGWVNVAFVELDVPLDRLPVVDAAAAPTPLPTPTPSATEASPSVVLPTVTPRPPAEAAVPAEATPAEATPAEATPTEAAPTEAAPTATATIAPTLVEPTPAEPAPAEPAPAEPTPAEPTPAVPPGGRGGSPPAVAAAPEGTPQAAPAAARLPSISPDGTINGMLAFQDGRDNIYVYNLNSGDLRLLTQGFDPAISPDGRTVAFIRGGGNDNGIYTIGIDGSDERKIWGEGEILRSPKWSPDGKFITYTRLIGSYKCYDIKFLGCKSLKQLIAEFPFLVIPAARRAFLSEAERLEFPNWGLSRVASDGSGNFRDIAALDSAVAPDWNEAGIVYQSAAGIEITEDTPTGGTRAVFQEDWDHDPDWQPNGGLILFQSKEGSHWEIWRISSEGGGLVALTRPVTTLVDQLPFNVAPAWSYDGQQIVYLSSRADDEEHGPWRLWVMNADGSNKRRLPIDVEIDYAFADEQVVSWGPPVP